MRKMFYLLLLLCSGLFVASVASPSPITNDGEEYLYASHNLLQNNTLYAGDVSKKTLDFRLFSKRTVGLPIVLLFQYQNRVLISAFQCLLSIVIFFVGLQLLRNFTEKRLATQFYATGFIFSISLFLHIGFVLSDVLLTAIITTMALLYYCKINSLHHRTIALCLLWTFAILVKPILLPTLPFSILLFIYFIFKKKKIMYSTLILPLVVLVFSVINYTSTGKLEYSSISTINLAQYNAKLTIAKKYGYDSAQLFVESESLDIPHTKSEYDRYSREAKNLGIDAISQNVWTYAQVHTLGILKMILDPGRFELYTFFKEKTNETSLTEMLYAKNWRALKKSLFADFTLVGMLLLGTIFSLLKLFGTLLNLANWKKSAFLYLIIAYFLIITGPVGAARFFLPVSIVFLVCSVQGWLSFLHFFQKSSKG